MLRQRRMGGDQEEMGGYYIGEVDEVIIHIVSLCIVFHKPV